MLERESILTIDDITLLILNIAVSTGNFTIEGLIEEVYKFTYKSLVKEENYLESNSTENLLLFYLSILTKKKDKNKLLLVSLPLIISEG